MKKLLLVIGVLCLSLSAFAEKLNGTFEGKLHEVIISNFTYDGKGKNVYIVLTKDGDFKNSEIISKELKKAVVNDELKIKVNNLSKLIDKGYNTVSVYTKTGKSSFGDAVLTKEASVTVTPVAPTTPAPKK